LVIGFGTKSTNRLTAALLRLWTFLIGLVFATIIGAGLLLFGLLIAAALAMVLAAYGGRTAWRSITEIFESLRRADLSDESVDETDLQHPSDVDATGPKDGGSSRPKTAPAWPVQDRHFDRAPPRPTLPGRGRRWRRRRG
jgi:ABC-type multidrug transport system fused ATPase/permease subunit